MSYLNGDITLYWQAVGEMDTDYSVFVHLWTGRGLVWGQQTVCRSERHTSDERLWQPGEFWSTDVHVLALPPDLPLGITGLRWACTKVETGLRPRRRRNGDKVTLDKISLAR